MFYVKLYSLLTNAERKVRNNICLRILWLIGQHDWGFHFRTQQCLFYIICNLSIVCLQTGWCKWVVETWHTLLHTINKHKTQKQVKFYMVNTEWCLIQVWESLFTTLLISINWYNIISNAIAACYTDLRVWHVELSLGVNRGEAEKHESHESRSSSLTTWRVSVCLLKKQCH